MLPDFNRLRVFQLVMETGSVSGAAKQLHVTQSAVSQHLKKLEEELGTALFTRLQNRLVPTDAASRLQGIVAPFVTQIAEEIKVIDHGRAEPYGVLRIGAPVEFGTGILPRLFAGFRKKHPQVSFELELGHSSSILSKLETGRLDMVFADIFSKKPEHNPDYALFHIEPVLTEELILVCSRKYLKSRLANDRSFSSLAHGDYVTYRPDAAAIKAWFRYHHGKYPRPMNTALTVESVRGVVAAITEHMGLGVVPSHVIEKELATKKLVRVTHRKKPLSHQISLARLLDKIPTLTEKHFAAHVLVNPP